MGNPHCSSRCFDSESCRIPRPVAETQISPIERWLICVQNQGYHPRFLQRIPRWIVCFRNLTCEHSYIAGRPAKYFMGEHAIYAACTILYEPYRQGAAAHKDAEEMHKCSSSCSLKKMATGQQGANILFIPRVPPLCMSTIQLNTFSTDFSHGL